MKFGKFFMMRLMKLSLIFKNINIKSLKVFSNLCDEALKAVKRNKILFCGNGGSAADAQHLAAELVVKYKKKEKPFLQLHFLLTHLY